MRLDTHTLRVHLVVLITLMLAASHVACSSPSQLPKRSNKAGAAKTKPRTAASRKTPTVAAMLPRFDARFDARVELFFLLSRLAGAPEHSGAATSDYLRAVDAHFRAHANHPAVVASRKLLTRGAMRYDAPAALAVSLTPSTLKPIDPDTKNPAQPAHRDGRWNGVALATYLGQVRAFAADTRFDLFMAQHKARFQSMADQYRKAVNQLGIIAWFARNVAAKSNTEYVVVPSFVVGTHNYATQLRRPDGSSVLYQVLGVNLGRDGKPNIAREALAGTLFHEVAHSYVNPAVAKHHTAFAAVGKRLFARSISQWKKMAYGKWQTVINESCVRALTTLYMRDQFGMAQGFGWLVHETSHGFPWTGDLVSALDKLREKHGARGVSLTAHLPVLAAALLEWERTHP